MCIFTALSEAFISNVSKKAKTMTKFAEEKERLTGIVLNSKLDESGRTSTRPLMRSWVVVGGEGRGRCSKCRVMLRRKIPCAPG